MSLINDVLRDLQTRQAARAQPLAGLRPVAVTRRMPWLRRALVPAIALALASTAWAAWRTAGPADPAALVLSVARSLPEAEPAVVPEQALPVTIAAQSEHADIADRAEPAPANTREPRWATLGDFARSLASYDGAPVAKTVAPPRPASARVSVPAAAKTGSAQVRSPAVIAAAPAGDSAPTESGAGLDSQATPAEETGSIVVSRRSQGEEPGQRLRAALLAVQNGMPAEAEAALRQITEDTPAFADAWIHLAQTQAQLGRAEQAERTLYEALAQVERSERVARALARHMLMGKRTGDAIVVLETFRPNGPDADHDAFLAALYQRAGRHPEAVGIYRRLLGDDPGRGAWWMGLAISEEGIGRPAAALEAYRRISTITAVDPLLRDYAVQRIAVLGDSFAEVAQQ